MLRDASFPFSPFFPFFAHFLLCIQSAYNSYICQSRYFPRHMAAYDKIYRSIKYICGLGKLVTRLLHSFIVHIHMYSGMGRIYKYHIVVGRGRPILYMTNQMKMKLLNFNFRYVFQTAVN